MIKDGFWKPVELMNALQFMDETTGEIHGKASIGIVISNRTGGKTVNMTIELLKLYETQGLRSIILCRNKAEKEGKKGSPPYFPEWISKTLDIQDREGYIQGFLDRHEVRFDSDGLYVDNDQVMYCEAITDSITIKNTRHYDHVAIILMDEAIQIGERELHLLGDRRGLPVMTHIFTIWQTAARGWKSAINRCNIVFLSNVDEYDNWIFNDLHINEFVKPDTKRTCQNGIYFEKFINEEVKKQLTESTMGQIMQRSESGKRYFLGSVMNEYTDNKAFVQKRPLDFKNIVFQILYHGRYIGAFKIEGKIHFAKIDRDERAECITNQAEEVSETVRFDPMRFNYIRDFISNGQVTFQTQETKSMICRACNFF